RQHRVEDGVLRRGGDDLGELLLGHLRIEEVLLDRSPVADEDDDEDEKEEQHVKRAAVHLGARGALHALLPSSKGCRHITSCRSTCCTSCRTYRPSSAS